MRIDLPGKGMDDTRIKAGLPRRDRKKAAPTSDAGFIRRTLAFAVDIIILQFIVITPFSKLLSGLSHDIRHLLSASIPGDAYAASIFISFMIFLYFTFTEFIAKKSIGKRLMGIEVVSETDDLRLSQVLLRNLAVLPLFPFILLWVADPLFMMFSKEQKRLSDLLARTKVVQVTRT